MSLMKHIINDLLPAVKQDYRYANQLVTPAERTLMRSLSNYENNHMRSSSPKLKEFEDKQHVDNDKFQVAIDVIHFAPGEISVKTVNNSIVVEAEHEERENTYGNGFVYRKFKRRYDLPEHFRIENITSTISSDGVLTIEVPSINPTEGPIIRQVQIQLTGPARLLHGLGEEEEKNIVEDEIM